MDGYHVPENVRTAVDENGPMSDDILYCSKIYMKMSLYVGGVVLWMSR